MSEPAANSLPWQTTKHEAFMEPSGCNRRQSVANQIRAEPAKQAKPVATGCHQLRETFHGKQGVSGSSSEEGSAKPANRGSRLPGVRGHGRT